MQIKITISKNEILVCCPFHLVVFKADDGDQNKNKTKDMIR
jgi:hypothetical protein